jgi:nucleoside-diphosphate-sugar epimerase
VETCLVTGGAGFIGSHLVERLLRDGCHVRVLDNFSSGRRVNLAAALEGSGAPAGRLEVLEGDLRSDSDVAAAVRDREVVFHEAALGSVERSVQDPMLTHEVNATGTLRLLIRARDAGVRRMLFAGSSSVYGDIEALPKSEEMPVRPISPYGLSKLAGELYCRIATRLYGLETVTLRYFNVFGPRQDPGSLYAAVIPIFISKLRAGEAPLINGDGEQSRDFTYVANVVEANILAARAPAEKVGGRLFNIACGSRYTLKQLVEILGRLTGSRIAPRHGPPRPGDVRHSEADITAARAALGFEPGVSFEEGLARTVDSFGRGATS